MKSEDLLDLPAVRLTAVVHLSTERCASKPEGGALHKGGARPVFISAVTTLRSPVPSSCRAITCSVLENSLAPPPYEKLINDAQLNGVRGQ